MSEQQQKGKEHTMGRKILKTLVMPAGHPKPCRRQFLKNYCVQKRDKESYQREAITAYAGLSQLTAIWPCRADPQCDMLQKAVRPLAKK